MPAHWRLETEINSVLHLVHTFFSHSHLHSCSHSHTLTLTHSLMRTHTHTLSHTHTYLHTQDDDDDELTPGYTAPKQVDLKTLQELDADDEALVKYKQTLLGQTEAVKGKTKLHVCHCLQWNPS